MIPGGCLGSINSEILFSNEMSSGGVVVSVKKSKLRGAGFEAPHFTGFKKKEIIAITM